MNRRAFLCGSIATALAKPLAVEGQQAGQMGRVGFLGTSSASAGMHAVEAFRAGLRDLGHIEGRTFIIDYRWADGHYERLAAHAADLVRLRMDVILAPTQQAALAARKATATVPIVVAVATDLPELGLIDRLGRPAGNITGLTSLPGPEFVGKQMELFKEAVPNLVRLAILGNPANATYAHRLEGARVAARSLGVHLRILGARGPDEVEISFLRIDRASADGLLVLHDAMLWTYRARLAELAATRNMPTMFHWREHVDAGGLMAYGASIPDLLRRAATFVDKLLRGAKPSDLPVEQPTQFDLVINLKTARALGLTIPPSLLLRANEVIE